MIFYPARQSAEILGFGDVEIRRYRCVRPGRDLALLMDNVEARGQSAGSWEADVDGAQARRRIMPGTPVLDEPYRQEFYAGHMRT